MLIIGTLLSDGKVEPDSEISAPAGTKVEISLKTDNSVSASWEKCLELLEASDDSELSEDFPRFNIGRAVVL